MQQPSHKAVELMDRIWRLVFVILGATISLISMASMGIGGWSLNQIVDLKTTTLSDQEGRELWLAIRNLESRINSPPDWFVQRFDDLSQTVRQGNTQITAQIDSFSERLRGMESRLSALEARLISIEKSQNRDNGESE